MLKQGNGSLIGNPQSPALPLEPHPARTSTSEQWHNLRPEKLTIWSLMTELLRAESSEMAPTGNLPGHGLSAGDEATGEALQIYQAYSQCQAEIALYQHAIAAASQRERELSQQLYTILGGPQHAAPSGKSPLRLVRDKHPKTSLKVFCLGSFRVYRNSQLISEWSSLKARAIFKYLLVNRSTPTSSDVLMDLFWPEADPESARHNLHQAIHSLRKTLKQNRSDPQPIVCEPDGYVINSELELWLDRDEFEKNIQSGRRLEAMGQLAEAISAYRQAEELYRGDFLEEDLYEDWPNTEREHLRNTYADLIDRLSEYYFQQADYPEAIVLCQRILNQDNCHEIAYRRLMRCYLAQGQRRLAIRQFQVCAQTLKAELDVPPSAETQSLYQHILRGEMVLAAAA
jgi:DNA-binding SARP family transcriptional activator